MGGAIQTAVKAGVVTPIRKVAQATGIAEKPQAPAAPAAPAGNTAAKVASQAEAMAQSSGLGAQQMLDQSKKRRGRAATILTGYEGVGSTQVGTKTLLGS
jgi:negative regulator of sigma E activity|nr:MAG TPA: hypothetical protein [Caudoviricetes sp.]